MAADHRAEELRRQLLHVPVWDLTARQLCDIELLLNGGFWPLTGFLNRRDYELLCEGMRLSSGALWAIPIMLDVTEAFAATLERGSRIALRHPEGMTLAVLTVEDIWSPDRRAEAEAVFGTTDESHPGVFHLLHEYHPVYLGGRLEGLELPPHHTFRGLRHTPTQLKQKFVEMGWEQVVAFQTRNPMHRAHVELTLRAAAEHGGKVLLHPVVGRTRPGDVDYFARARCYQAVLKQYPEGAVMLSLLPLAMRMAGPREALWHAQIRSNYGATHFIVGRDHAGPGEDSHGNSFYPPYAAQEIVRRHEKELGIQVIPFEEMVCMENTRTYLPRSKVPEGATVLAISGSDLRRRLQTGEALPDWFSYPEVIAELRRSFPPRAEQGFTVFFTGLSGSGKSTIAQILVAKLMELGDRPVTLLDGDVVRKHLSSELGFSKEHRDLNIQRIGFVASEITKNQGVAICAPIAPYAVTRRMVREMIEQYGGFIEVYVSTPLEVCEERDRKGLYAKARAGLISGFTGIDDPYEAPVTPEVEIDTTTTTPEQAVNAILQCLREEGYLR